MNSEKLAAPGLSDSLDSIMAYYGCIPESLGHMAMIRLKKALKKLPADLTMATEEELVEVEPLLSGIGDQKVLASLSAYGNFDTLDISGETFFVIDQSEAEDRQFRTLTSYQKMMSQGLDARTPITAFMLAKKKGNRLHDYLSATHVGEVSAVIDALKRENELLDADFGFPGNLMADLLSRPRTPFWIRPEKLLRHIPGVRSINPDYAGCLLAASGSYSILADEWMIDREKPGLPIMIRGRGRDHPVLFHDPDLSPAVEIQLPPEPVVLQLEGPATRRIRQEPRWKTRTERWKHRKTRIRGSERRRGRSLPE